jgi:hypothetical protein
VQTKKESIYDNPWFPDQVEPIDDKNDYITHYQFLEYWKREKDRCINGFDLASGKVHIPGKLYFHTVYCKIAAYTTNEETGKKRRDIITPVLRDIDWDIFNDLETCTNKGVFYCLVGARDFGKSIIAATCTAHQYTFYSNSESVISSGDAKYIKMATDKVATCLMYLHPVFRKNRVANDWKNEVRAGWKLPGSTEIDPRSSNSVIYVRNYDDGTNSMAANGTRGAFHLIDEIGTIPNLIGCVKDSDGCWWSGDGDKPSCLVMLAGTGGDMEVGEEAGEIFYNPEAYNMLAFDDPESTGKIGRFISVLRAKMKYKEPKTLAWYLGIAHPDLEKITILVSNEQKCLKEWYEPKLSNEKKSGNSKALLKFKAYNPLTPSESFLRVESNIFNSELSKVQQGRIRALNIEASLIELLHDGQKIVHKFSNKLPISQFPIKDQPTDAPIQVWEFPIQNAPWGLYVAGVDPYRHDKSTEIPSLGTVYIYKRLFNIMSDRFQDMFVASYVARTDRKEQWQEQARWLIKWYNALTLCENDEYGFIEYMVNKGDAMYLQPQPEWLKDIVAHSQVNRKFGLHRSPQIGAHLDGQLKEHFEKPIIQEKDESGSIVKEILGVQKVFDYMLLEETTKYDTTGKYKGKFDRIVGAGNAVSLASHLDPIYKVINKDTDSRFKSYGKKRKPMHGMFSTIDPRTGRSSPPPLFVK